MSLDFNVAGFELTAPALLFLMSKYDSAAVHGRDYLIGRAGDHSSNAFIAVWKRPGAEPTTQQLEQLANQYMAAWNATINPAETIDEKTATALLGTERTPDIALRLEELITALDAQGVVVPAGPQAWARDREAKRTVARQTALSTK